MDCARRLTLLCQGLLLLDFLFDFLLFYFFVYGTLALLAGLLGARKVEPEPLALCLGFAHELLVQLLLHIGLDRTIDQLDVAWGLWPGCLCRALGCYVFKSAAIFGHLGLGVLDQLGPEGLDLVAELDEYALVENRGPDVIVALELLGVLLSEVEGDSVVEQERVRDVILGVALQVEDEPELVIDLVLLPHLLELVADPLPELGEPNGRHEDP